MSEVITALISALSVGVPSVLATYISNKRHGELMDYKISELTKQVEKHNNVMERMALAEREIKAIWRNVDEIKKEVKEDEK